MHEKPGSAGSSSAGAGEQSQTPASADVGGRANRRKGNKAKLQLQPMGLLLQRNTKERQQVNLVHGGGRHALGSIRCSLGSAQWTSGNRTSRRGPG